MHKSGLSTLMQMPLQKRCRAGAVSCIWFCEAI
ncbi:hypothetical protein SPV1_12642 [Mariprofundus ferrooxydans PV-1]|uniref:Uncharacterized protein n=1 Tax=Mariprofundus ferrooxydans PV-1 TaxID=314345 RepID=Q0EX53_9PROT|nr:hypothetical protein SPV1_12642 [Mariprofundus ferrooxydans PV-1]